MKNIYDLNIDCEGLGDQEGLPPIPLEHLTPASMDSLACDHDHAPEMDFFWIWEPVSVPQFGGSGPVCGQGGVVFIQCCSEASWVICRKGREEDTLFTLIQYYALSDPSDNLFLTEMQFSKEEQAKHYIRMNADKFGWLRLFRIDSGHEDQFPIGPEPETH